MLPISLVFQKHATCFVQNEAILSVSLWLYLQGQKDFEILCVSSVCKPWYPKLFGIYVSLLQSFLFANSASFVFKLKVYSKPFSVKVLCFILFVHQVQSQGQDFVS